MNVIKEQNKQQKGKRNHRALFQDPHQNGIAQGCSINHRIHSVKPNKIFSTNNSDILNNANCINAGIGSLNTNKHCHQGITLYNNKQVLSALMC